MIKLVEDVISSEFSIDDDLIHSTVIKSEKRSKTYGSKEDLYKELKEEFGDEEKIYHSFNAAETEYLIGQEVFYSDCSGDSWEIGILENLDIEENECFKIKDKSHYSFIKEIKYKTISKEDAELMLKDNGIFVKIK